MTARNSSLRHLPSHSLDVSYVHLDYQPQICLRTGDVLGAEALLRYDDPRYGRISTREVLRAAEHSGMLQALTQEVLDLAVCDVAAWRRIDPGTPMRVAINLSRAQLTDPCLGPMLTATLGQWSVAAGSVEVEIEEADVPCLAAPAATVSALKRLGLRVVVDAAGYGDISDALLRRLEVDAVKIDKGLVDLIEDPVDGGAAVVSALHRAERYGFESVAEGVETTDQLAFLERHGCDRIQGYLMSRPLAADALSRFVRRRQMDPSGTQNS